MTKEQISQKISMLNEENFDRFSNEQHKFFNETKYEGFFPSEEDFNHYRQFALAHRNEAQLNVSFKYWEFLAFGVLEPNDTYNFQDIITYLTASQSITLVDWIRFHGQNENTVRDYKKFRLSLEEMENYINPIIETTTNELIDKLVKIQSSIAKPGEIRGFGNSNSNNYKEGRKERKPQIIKM